MRSFAVFAALLCCCAASPLRVVSEEASTTNLTVYHVNPKSAGALPVNMDTGDALGDLYFYLGQFLLPLECKNVSKQSRAHFDCDNPERVDPNLVATKVDMRVDPEWTTYSACNLCNGTDPFTQQPCKLGTYICDCESRHGPPCDHTKVGQENITEHFAPSIPSPSCNSTLYKLCGEKRHGDQCFDCVKEHYMKLHFLGGCQDRDLEEFCPNPWHTCGEPNGPDWSCWEENIPRKTGGFWYSSMAEGKGKGWQVQSMKTIKEECLKDHVMTAVEKADKEACFPACGKRNITATCWIGCFFDTLLGKDARKSSSRPLGGMAIADVERGWTSAFLPEDQGGCAEESM